MSELKPALTVYDKIKTMSLIEMASFLSTVQHAADYEDDDYDPEVMEFLKAKIPENDPYWNNVGNGAENE